MSDQPDPRIAEYYAKARTGHRRSLGRLLSAVERGGATADHISELAFPDLNHAPVVGITGAPGSGKSTLTGALVDLLVERGFKPAVLAIDPSSPLTGGAILGDRIRMDDRVHSARHLTPGDPSQPFIRSMATRGHAGGLALAVPAALRLFDIAGYSPIIIETVGIGQVEVDVAAVCDTTVVVVTPEGGDAVQANKSGLLEVADVFVVNKSDRPGADQTKRDLELMLDLSHISGLEEELGHRPTIVMTTAIAATDNESQVGIVWDAMEAHRLHLESTNTLDGRRTDRLRAEVRNRVEQLLLDDVAQAMDAAAADQFVDGTPPTRLAADLYAQLRRL